MSNLLNSGKPKKKLLDRGPKITPNQEFKLEPQEEAVQQEITSPPIKAEIQVPEKTLKRRGVPEITSVRVSKTTRNKLNALIQLGKADNVDILIDILLDEYMENNLVKDEKKTYSLILDIIKKRDR